MKAAAYILPVLLVIVVSAACIRRVRVYESFAKGAGGALPLVKGLFPYIAAVLILEELFEASGLAQLFARAAEPLFTVLGIPSEIAPLVLIKPFSGSGSLALVSELCETFGADSYIARCACCVYASGETVFYLSAIYFSQSKEHTAPAVGTALFANCIACIVACLLCRFL